MGWLAAGVVLAAGPLPADPPPDDAGAETEIKVAMVYKIARFVEWPVVPDEAFVLGVAAGDDVAAAFGLLAGKTLGGRSVTVRRLRREDDFAGCDLVYLADGAPAALGRRAREAPGPVLTVSDGEGFGRAGGIVELARDRNRLRFLVNPAAARDRGLRLSSQLLKLATIVEGA